MTPNTKRKIAIIAMAIMLLSLIIYTGIVIGEFFISKYGEVVDAKVIDVSEVCRHKRKYVTLLIESEPKQCELYGLSCRKDEFLLGSIIQVRRSKRFNILVIPNNQHVLRLLLFSLLTALVFMGFITLVKAAKKGT